MNSVSNPSRRFTTTSMSMIALNCFPQRKKQLVYLVTELPELLSRGGFQLTKWVSNEKEVVSQVPISERASTVNLDLNQLPTERALGMEWNVEDDTFGFRGGTVKAETRRGILS